VSGSRAEQVDTLRISQVTTLLLIRHGRTTANSKGILAGRNPGIELDRAGREQAQDLADRLRDVPLTHIVTSPLERTVSTAKALVSGRDVKLLRDRRIIECDYGSWSGKKLKTLAKDPLWVSVQAHPSAVTFPDGESMAGAQLRAVAAARAWSARAERETGKHSIVALVSHGDVIKSILADALGMHLDAFQRIVIDPASVSVLTYTPLRPFVSGVNEQGDLGRLIPAPTASSDSAVGGGAGSARAHS